jgi:serine/threonine protein phosphatase PrpC
MHICRKHGQALVSMILTLGDSRTGLVRKVNEDAINLDVENVYILADGMGGYEGGQIASTLAVESAGNFLERLEPAELSESNLKECWLTRPYWTGSRMTISFFLWVQQ